MTHSKAPWLTRGSAIALMMAAGIALAACGGGGGLNEDESAGIQQQLEDALAQATADAAARVTAEAEAAAAETAKATAEAEKATAEAEKAAADTARDLAVAEAAAAETAKATAVAEKDKAEAEKAAADTAREAADTARDLAVAEAAAAETAKAAADAARELADAAREAAVAEAALARAATETAVAEAAEARTAQQAAEKARDAAEVARIAAEENADGQVALAVTANMAAQVADAAVVQANADLIVAQDKQKQAEDDRDAAIADRNEAQSQLRLAEAARALAEQQGRDAEADREQAEQDRDDAQQQVIRADSRLVRDGLLTEITGATVMVVPRYNASATVTTTSPSVSFLNPTTSSLSGWYKTAFVKSAQAERNRLEVYSDVERLPDIPFKDSRYNLNNAIVNAEGEVFARYDIMGARPDVAGSGFPRTSGGPRSYDLDSRGMTASEFMDLNRDLLTAHDEDNNLVIDSSERDQAFRDDLEDADITLSQYSQYINERGFRDTDRYPEQYNAEVSGTLGGASGRYVCSSDMSATPCTVQNRGSDLNFVGPWTFRPSSATTGVDAEDTVYMYFGWWSREKFNPEDNEQAWTFETFHGPVGSRVDDADISTVTGSATYRGPAAGYYAIYEPNSAGSDHGAFSATATLNADFDTDMVQGTIDQFSGQPDWSLALERGAITNGNTGQSTTGVTWTIGGTPAASDRSWEASFYSNLVEDNPQTTATENVREGVMPSGIAGTFSATYDDIGRLTGAFGAHCVDAVCRP